MTNPIVFYYTESAAGEAFAVHANGEISRPDIGMQPSGGWRFLGTVTARGASVMNHRGVVAALAASQPVLGKHIADLDHGTTRQHGRPFYSIWLAGSAPSDCVALAEQAELDRQAAARAKREAEAAAAKARQARNPVVWRLDSLAWPIELRRARGGRLAVIYGEQISEGLTYSEASRALGEALLHALTCEGVLDHVA